MTGGRQRQGRWQWNVLLELAGGANLGGANGEIACFPKKTNRELESKKSRSEEDAHVAELLGWLANGVELDLMVLAVRADECWKMVNWKKATLITEEMMTLDSGFAASTEKN